MFEQSRSVYASVAHRYWNPQWDEARNRSIYGPQASIEGVGSNLLLEAATNSTDLDVQPALEALKAICDHRCFYTDIDGFSERPSTLETMSRFLAQNLFAMPGPWVSLRVAEDERLSCVVYPGLDTVDMRVKVLNLELCLRRSMDADSGLALDRNEVWTAVRAVAPEFADPQEGDETAWAERLFAALQIKVKGLHQLTIDLGRQRQLRVRSGS